MTTAVGSNYYKAAAQSKFEDMALINQAEIQHVHFEVMPAEAALEVSTNANRVFPGLGLSLLQRVVNKLSEKGYSRALSLQLFDPVIQNTAHPLRLPQRGGK